VRAWSQAYRDDGLLVVDGVRQAVEVRDIDYPVAQDNGYRAARSAALGRR
jgi:hypothetical protein